MKEKRCTSCREVKPVSEFNKKRTGLQPNCRKCQKDYMADWYNKNKTEYVVKVRARSARIREELQSFIKSAKEKPCTDCGHTYPYYIMDFDHLPEFIKSNDISKMVGRGLSKDKIQAEIDKCEVVCSNCHRQRTHNRRQASIAQRKSDNL